MRLADAARVGASLAAAKLTGAAVPFLVTIYPTMRCNLRCVYCSSPYERSSELSVHEWRTALEELASLGAHRIAILGGEPLMRADIGEIVAAVRTVGLKAAMTTNGTLVPRHRDVVERLHTLVVSVDGDRQAHDRNRGEGSHADALAAIDLARSWGVPVKINAVLSADSTPSLPWLLAFAERERLPLTLNLMRSEEVGLWHDAAAHRQSRDEIARLLDAIVEAKRRNPWVLFSTASYRVAAQWQDFTRDRLTAAEAGDTFPGPRCSAGRFFCSIHADGSLYPCSITMNQLPALNVRTAGVAAALARARHHGCATCHTPCRVEQNALFALQPSVVASLARTYLRTRLE